MDLANNDLNMDLANNDITRVHDILEHFEQKFKDCKARYYFFDEDQVGSVISVATFQYDVEWSTDEYGLKIYIKLVNILNSSVFDDVILVHKKSDVTYLKCRLCTWLVKTLESLIW